ncbi:MAG: tail fiber domain-containing protein, partial [bacterium]|nr:tail fiber domain-containing protein [bacterium]
RQNPETAGLKKEKFLSQNILVQTGYFQVKNRKIVTPAAPETGIAKPLDEVINDDLIVDGSLCVGNDCYNGYAFGFDTIALMENNLRIYFDDTSNTSSFPNNDWRIVINDTTDGGGKYFAVQDVSGGKIPFTIEAGAKTNSLYIDDDGQVGIGTSGPVFELHIREGDSPTVRLHQDTSYGWPEQIWDVGGNETSFFIRDGTHAARLPFRIEPETPSSTLCLKSDGKVGIGTWAPEASLEVETTGENAKLILERTSGAKFKLNVTDSLAQIGSHSNHNVNFVTNNTVKMTIESGGDVGIGLTNPSYLLHLDGGAYCDGGAWMPGSSRELKENIIDLTLEDAADTLMELNPVRFKYKKGEEDYIGFIAEDVPQLVATKERKSVSPMDVVAVLTKVVQQQQKAISELKEKITKLEEK